MNQLLASSGQSIGASASVLSVNIQSCFPLGLIILISLQSMGLSRVISNTTVQKHQFFDIQPSLWSNSHIHTWLLKKNHSFDYMDLCHKVMSLLFNMLSRFVIAFVSRRREFFFQKAVLPSLLISWLQSPSTVILEMKKIKSATLSTFSPPICHKVMGPDAMILVFLILSFKPAFSLSTQNIESSEAYT